ncbi:hypothetical protein F503_07356 [Ophiostoma piceae UAMH 11346]|uniref:Uncharacterized protein n=1 Tax=Ophiostoma piceae (strain UAMH 11346) TaxID=1262450 RepID=S3D814_OPHP1|nr:hypothetical protein F503_07356 [Ophiostoma piceae UAMH 11346]
MAPVRRYLRITKYSVLECRIYVDNPALVQSWLLHPRDPVLPRVMESVRPLVLPKLMEERDRARKKGTSKKNKGAIRDVLVEKDFEVSLFLIETNTRHSLLYKHRRARDKTQTRLVSNSSKLTGGETNDAPIDVDVDADLGIELGDDGLDDDNDDIVLTAESTGLPSVTGASAPPRLPPNLLVEDSDDEEGGGLKALQAIPDIHEARPDGASTQRRSKRRRNQSNPVNVDESGDEDNGSLFGSEGGDNDVISDDDNDLDADDAQPPKKRSRVVPVSEGDMEGDGEEGSRKKKKLAMDVIYEGFAIYGRVLCLVVKQRGAAPRGRSIRTMLPSPAATSSSTSTAAVQTPGKPEGQAAMENWIASTQIPVGGGADEA